MFSYCMVLLWYLQVIFWYLLVLFGIYGIVLILSGTALVFIIIIRALKSTLSVCFSNFDAGTQICRFVEPGLSRRLRHAIELFCWRCLLLRASVSFVTSFGTYAGLISSFGASVVVVVVSSFGTSVGFTHPSELVLDVDPSFRPTAGS